MNLKRVLICLISIVTIASGCNSKISENIEIIRKVKVSQVESTSVELTKEYSGIINEAEEVNLAFRVAGKIQKINFKEGEFVKKGELIAELDPRDYQVQVSVAKAQYDQVSAEAARVQELYSRKSVAQNDNDKAIAGEKMTSAQLKHAIDQLNDTKLYAPFSGYIQTLNYDNGEMLNIGLTFGTIINVDYYSIDVNIPASLFIDKNNFTSFSCQQSMVSDDWYPLELISYNKKANSNQLYKLHFRLDPKVNKKLAPGMDVKVNIVYNSNVETSVQIPLSSVFNINGKSFVWVYDKSNQTVQSREIRTGSLNGNGYVRVVNGLLKGESIIVSGVNILKENQKVEPIKEVSKTNVGGLL